MRKQTKLVAVLSATALLALGATMTAMAATGWVEEDGVWMFLDRDGDAVTEEWKKSGNNYYWLDENGEMAIDTLVDDGDSKYYVDENGARVINSWRQVDNEDGWTNGENDYEPDSVWYYFGSTGKANTGRKTINDKIHIFDETGEMFSGWTEHNNITYYLGDDNEGFAYTGWHFIELKDTYADEYEENEGWFHFKTNGEMRVANEGEETTRAYINGAYYGFDGNGVMVDGWVPPNDATATNSAYYTDETGAQKKGWVLTHANTEYGEDEDPVWFYLNSKGKPFNIGGFYTDDNSKVSTGIAQKYEDGQKTGDEIEQVAARVISSKTYLFDNSGEMLEGVYEFQNSVDRVGGAGNLEPGFYYFSKNDGSAKGQMVTGKTSINFDGETFNYYFTKTGKAYTNTVIDSTLYKANGVRLDAEESRMVYEVNSNDFDGPITVNNSSITINEGDRVIVSSSGKLKKSGTVTIDGTKYTLKDFVIVEEN